MFEEMTLADGKSNKGRVEAYSGPIYLADAALYLMAHKPELGIKDPYYLDETQFAAAVDLLSSSASWSPSIGTTTRRRWTTSRTKASWLPPPGRCR